MDSSDIFMPSSYTTGPGTFLSHFGPEDQLFQRPLLNTLGQNYVPNPRPLQQQRDSLFDQPQTRISPTQRTIYPPPRNYLLEQQPAPPPPPLPPPNPFIEYQRAPPQQRYDDKNPLNNQDLFFTDHNEDQFEQQQQAQLSQRNSEQQEQDSRRQGKLITFIKKSNFLCFVKLFGMNYNEAMLKFKKKILKNTNQPLEIELHLVQV
jgi:hypothetical protein